MRTPVELIVFSLLGCVLPGRGQQPLVGCIQGTVKDLHGAPIPYAGLTASNIDSVNPQWSRQTTGADRHGFYQFVDVTPGRYSIVVTKKGYRDYTVPVVTVRDGETVTLPDIKMSAKPRSQGDPDAETRARPSPGQLPIERHPRNEHGGE